MNAAAGGAGWAAALGATALALDARRELARRSRMVARACHELRAPLTAAGLGLHAAGGPGLRLARVEAELDRAARALDDLQGAPYGREPVHEMGWVDLVALARSVAAGGAPLASRQGTRIALGASGPRVAWVRGDRGRLEQAGMNLLRNAVEHGVGRVKVAVRLGARRAVLCVEDEGPGLPAPLHRLIADAPHGRRGHGLAVAAEIASRHGGRLVQAPGGPGTRLALELPAPAEPAPPLAASAP